MKKRTEIGTPDVLNINVSAPMGENNTLSPPGTAGSPEEQQRRQNIDPSLQMATGTQQEGGIRVASNDDLHDTLMGVDSDKTSNTSDELSENSETYDFLNVYMPYIRPKEIDENEAEENASK